MNIAVRVTTGRTAALAAALACGCLAVWALALAFADLAMAQPRAALAAWQSGAPLPEVARRRALLARMGRAVAVHPFDAAQRLDLGRFFAWHAARHRAGSPRHRLYAALAAARFEEAVRARPTWGHAWLLLAEQWAALGRDEAAVLSAMRRGAALAPLEPGSQLKHLWLALARWPRLGEAHRESVRESLSRLLASRRYFADAARIAVHHRREQLLAGAVHAPWQQQALARIVAERGG